ncbi:helix-turn-helix transcriptional regulator [Salinimicrobium sp. TIG7-5_MAKvit]|uniref:helix-turn-helix domain-containing protein n=1 Tax=Salinimicrobium sp. TIG7-5_MAKvit TaxID=3121289 RepID=UPI003C6E38C3
MTDKTDILQIFGNSVRQVRLSKGISQEELAHLAGFHRTYIGMIERAERNITLKNIEKLASALEVSLTSLLPHESKN